MLAQAQRKRDVAVAVEYQRVGDDNSLGVTTEIPVFLYNNQKAAIVQAAAQQRVAEAQLRQAETQAVTDVEKAYQAYLTARQASVIYGRDGLREAERVREIVSFSYGRGEASLFELLDAQRVASQAAVAANQARAAYQLALWQLEQAIGGSLR
jgi:cobalt-zinc-cadmium efflux system outer membrane protein